MPTLKQKQHEYIARLESLNREFMNIFPDEVAKMRSCFHYSTEAQMQAALEKEDWLNIGETLSDLYAIAQSNHG